MNVERIIDFTGRTALAYARQGNRGTIEVMLRKAGARNDGALQAGPPRARADRRCRKRDTPVSGRRLRNDGVTP